MRGYTVGVYRIIRLSAAFCGAFFLTIVLIASCVPVGPATDGRKTIVVTYAVLGSIVQDLAGDKANVVILMPNGADPHGWEPSARDLEKLNRADLIVQNGLELEGGLLKSLREAARRGVKTFVSSDHIAVRRVGAGEGIPGRDADQAPGAADPHLWTDPLTIKDVAAALALQLKADLGLDLETNSAGMQARLLNLHKEISIMAANLPPEKRRLVTGHESMGYFAQRYGFQLLGAIIPSISTQAGVSASDLAVLKKLIEFNKVKAVFTELGTSPAVAQAVAKETGARAVEISTHVLPADGSYFTFERTLAGVIIDALK